MFPPGAAALDQLVVERHVLDVERDVLLGLPVDGLGELFLRHLGQADLLDDDRVPRDAGGDLVRLDLVGAEEPLDRVDDGARVHDGPVDDRLGRQRLQPELQQVVLATPPAGLQLHGLDR
jgi:hypothetical protein